MRPASRSNGLAIDFDFNHSHVCTCGFPGDPGHDRIGFRQLHFTVFQVNLFPGSDCISSQFGKQKHAFRETVPDLASCNIRDGHSNNFSDCNRFTAENVIRPAIHQGDGFTVLYKILRHVVLHSAPFGAGFRYKKSPYGRLVIEAVYYWPVDLVMPR
nr:MAG TPA: hypothetical protein [Caudoviricetes sp.]